MRIVGKRTWYFASIVLGIAAIAFEMGSMQRVARGVSIVAKRAQAKSDGVAEDMRSAMTQEAEIAIHRGVVLASIGFFAAAGSAVCLVVAVKSQRSRWRSIALVVLIVYATLSLVMI